MEFTYTNMLAKLNVASAHPGGLAATKKAWDKLKQYPHDVIRQVTPTHVFIEPLQNQIQGFGTPYYQYGQPVQFVQPYYPYRPGFGLGIALGAIGTLAILPWFFI